MPNREPVHTAEVQDIISKVPSWLLRWGITMFFALLVLVIAFSAFVRYPDVVNTTLKVRCTDPPQAVTTRYNGKILKLLVKDNELVKAGQPLAYMANGLNIKGENILTAPEPGRLNYAAIFQAGQVLKAGQDVFYISPVNQHFFGEMSVAQNDICKLKVGQKVLIRFTSSGLDEHGMQTGHIEYILNTLNKEGRFMAKVNFDNDASLLSNHIHLSDGLLAEAKVITKEASVLDRVSTGVWKTFPTR